MDTDKEIVIVGHSAAGSVLPVVTALTPNVRRLVFVDASVPPCEGTSTAGGEFLAALKGLAIHGMLPACSRWWGEGGKTDTFVLDFRNDADDILQAFQRYYEAVVVEPTDANVLYDLRARILAAGILGPTEITKAAEAYFGVDPAKRSLKVIHANLDPAVLRFNELPEGARDAFKDAADQFTRAYAFLSQVTPFTDAELGS